MNNYALEDLKENSYFTQELFLDKSFLLCTDSTPLTKQIIYALKDWDFTTVYSEGKIKEPIVKKIVVETKSEDVSSEFNENKAESAVNVESFDSTNDKSDSSRISYVKKVFDEYLKYIENVFKDYATKRKLDYSELSETVKKLIPFVKDNKRYILKIQATPDDEKKSFLINHAMRCAVFSILIGFQMHYPQDRLVELGVAAMVHEIGMLRIPPQLYLSSKILSPSEKAEMTKHPHISYEILKEYNFPPNILLGVLEHHEKENGKGYPLHLVSKDINPYAKILSVVCSYEAITSPRQYKSESTIFEGMVELLKNEGLQYNPTVIKALLLSISFYPIGAYVYLSNGKIAQVCEANPEDPKNPFVQILSEKDENGNFKTIRTSATGIHVTKVMGKQEASIILEKLKQSGNL